MKDKKGFMTNFCQQKYKSNLLCQTDRSCNFKRAQVRRDTEYPEYDKNTSGSQNSN